MTYMNNTYVIWVDYNFNYEQETSISTLMQFAQSEKQKT